MQSALSDVTVVEKMDVLLGCTRTTLVHETNLISLQNYLVLFLFAL